MDDRQENRPDLLEVRDPRQSCKTMPLYDASHQLKTASGAVAERPTGNWRSR
jgi:hypothetical protein